jgi:heme a synthase
LSSLAQPASQPLASGLSFYSKLVVASVFVLIFIGGLVTTWGAGMAVPDWPLSNGSLNPNGWWHDFPTRLEHGHRLFASLVGVLTLYLTGWVWRNRWIKGVAIAIFVGLIVSFVGGPQHTPRSASRTLIASLVFAGLIALVVGLISAVLWKTSPRASEEERPVRWLAWWAFVAVCLQATLGGLRVTGETAGMKALGLTLRIFHGCVAQAFLVILVTLAVLLTIRWRSAEKVPANRKVCLAAWISCGAIYLQLIFGAIMRHMGAGLAITTFPAARPDGSWLMPIPHNTYSDTNYLHTRIGAVLVTLVLLHTAAKVLRQRNLGEYVKRPAITLIALLAIQVTLGVLVVQHAKPPTMTTFHVVNGAALLATAVVLALRLQRPHVQESTSSEPVLSTSTPVTA